ncbi:MAG TPA: hypothetical protein VNI84_19125 [Pyrinomonadaceae bacterium]|nr:hypothetical protein [Pyrinomonadaceae bacterium]
MTPAVFSRKVARSLKVSDYQSWEFDTYNVGKAVRIKRRVSLEALPDAIKFVAFSDF